MFASAAELKLTNIAKKTDKIEGVTWYRDVRSPVGNNANAIFLYIGKDEKDIWLRARFEYASRTWLFIEKTTLVADGKKFEFAGRFDRDHDATIWEWKDTNASPTILAAFIAIASAKEAIVRYEGSKYKDDRIITQKEKDAIKNILATYDLLRNQKP